MTLRGIAEWNRVSGLPEGEKGSSSEEELKRAEDKLQAFILTDRLTDLEYLMEGGEFV